MCSSSFAGTGLGSRLPAGEHCTEQIGPASSPPPVPSWWNITQHCTSIPGRRSQPSESPPRKIACHWRSPVKKLLHVKCSDFYSCSKITSFCWFILFLVTLGLFFLIERYLLSLKSSDLFQLTHPCGQLTAQSHSGPASGQQHLTRVLRRVQGTPLGMGYAPAVAKWPQLPSSRSVFIFT